MFRDGTSDLYVCGCKNSIFCCFISYNNCLSGVNNFRSSWFWTLKLGTTMQVCLFIFYLSVNGTKIRFKIEDDNDDDNSIISSTCLLTWLFKSTDSNHTASTNTQVEWKYATIKHKTKATKNKSSVPSTVPYNSVSLLYTLVYSRADWRIKIF
jgi:hypothetical protein